MTLVGRTESALVVVDTQPGFVTQQSAAAVERAAWLAAVAAELGIPAVVVEEDPARNGPTDPRVHDRLPARTPVIAKPTFGLAGCPEAVAAVRATGRGTAVLVGFETDVCVAQSAIGLRALGFRAVAVEDATGSTSEEDHRRGLARMAAAGVELAGCKGLAYEWLRTVAEARAVISAVAERYGPAPLAL